MTRQDRWGERTREPFLMLPVPKDLVTHHMSRVTFLVGFGRINPD